MGKPSAQDVEAGFEPVDGFVVGAVPRVVQVGVPAGFDTGLDEQRRAAAAA